jgi:hypothetical protein
MESYIEVREIVQSMSRFEKREMFEEILDDLDYDLDNKWLNKVLHNYRNYLINKNEDDDFNNKILSLLNNKFKLTNEEEETIRKIVDRINP